LPGAVAEHLDLIEAIRTGDADRAAALMYSHV
jgi:DNA-binding GntR family transcriptional regulator